MTDAQSSIHENVLDSIEDGVIALDFQGRIGTFNQAASRILGVPMQGMEGRPFAEAFIELEGLDQFTQTILDTVSQSTEMGGQNVEVRLGDLSVSQTMGMDRRSIKILAGGQPRSLVIVATLLRAGEGASAMRHGIVAVFTDVTEVETLREAEAELAKKVEAQYLELQTAYRSVEDNNERLNAALRRVWVSRAVAVAAAVVLFVSVGYAVWEPAPSFADASEPHRDAETGGEAVPTVLTIEPRRLVSTLLVPGRLEPGGEARVASPVDGTVVALDFAYGGEVEKGQVLVELDVSKIEREHRALQARVGKAARTLGELEDWENGLDMARARRTLHEAERALEAQRLEVDESAFLLGEGIIPAQEHTTAVEEHERRRLDLEFARRELEVARQRGGPEAVRAASLEHRNLREQLQEMEAAIAGAVVLAPAAGIVTLPPAGAGAAEDGGPLLEGKSVTSGQLLLTIVDVETLSVAAVVDEIEIGKLRVGQPVAVTSDAVPGVELAGEIASVSWQAVGGTTSGAHAPAQFRVEAAIADVPPAVRRRLRLGMRVDMTVAVRDVPDALLVPLAAVRKARGAFELLVRDRESGAVRSVAVETGITNQGEVEIVSGLAAGDEVVVPEREMGPPA